MFFAQLISAIGYSSIFPFLPLYVESLGSQAGFDVEFLAGMVFSSQAFTMMIAAPIWGILADRHGRKPMVMRALLGGSLVILLMAFARSGEELVLLRALQGVVTGTIGAVNALVAAAAPKGRVGYAMGLLQVGLGGGVAVGPLIGGSLADAFGYPVVFFVTAALQFTAGLMVTLWVDEEFVPPGQFDEPTLGFVSEWRRLIKAPGVLTTYATRFTSQLGRMMIVPIAPLFIVSLMPESARVNTFTGLVIGTTALMTTLSGLLLGRFGDRVGHRKIVVVSALLAGVFYFPQSMVNAGWQLLVLQGLVGGALGGILPALSALLSGYTLDGQEGAAFGLDNAVNAGSRAVAPLVGAVVALAFGIRASFVAAGVLFLIAGAIGFWTLPDIAEPGSETG